MKLHVAVVGSGPAGLACAKALIKRGVRVSVLDVGEELDAGRQALAARLRSEPPEAWDQALRSRATENPTIATRAIPRKLVFGSDYYIVSGRPDWPTSAEGVSAFTTFAKGGFTVAWGGAMLPAADCDMSGWPFGRARLEPSYRRVLRDIPLSARPDRLAECFPLFRDEPRPLDLPKQALRFQRDVDRAGLPAPFSHFLHGQARTAVQAGGDDGAGCRYCGMCLSGCPYGSIYSTAPEIERLAARGEIIYLRDHLVESFREMGNSVEVRFLNVRDSRRGQMEFDRVFIGAGAINSTRIVLRSLGLRNRSVQILDSQKFVLPFLRMGADRLEWPAVNTLASIFLEAKLPTLSDHWIHMQISTPNDMVLRRLKVFPDESSRLRRLAMAPALSRLMIAWCSLHSDHSSRIELSLSGDAHDGIPVLEIRDRINPQSAEAVRRIAWALARAGPRFKSLFLAPLVTLSGPGVAGHCGGSFPMCQDSGSDVLGRPMGLERVHLVDASTFPSIPGTTIVLPIMANADRIASETPLVS